MSFEFYVSEKLTEETKSLTLNESTTVKSNIDNSNLYLAKYYIT